jgi:DNA-binding transcriptional LysR family regulator
VERTSVTLTDEGGRLYEPAMPLLEGLEQAAASVIEGRTTMRGRLQLNMHPFFSQFVQDRL